MTMLTRRTFAKAAAGTVAAAAILTGPVRAATTYKLATNLPIGHPMLTRLEEAAAGIKADTNGELEIRFFPNSQLGGDLEVLSQLRAGAIQFYPLAGAQLSTGRRSTASIGNRDQAFLKWLTALAISFCLLKIFPAPPAG